MGLLLSLVWIFIPIGLILAGAALIRKRGDPDTAEQRTFLFLTWTALGLLALQIANWIFPNLRFGYVIIFAPLLPALLVMALLHSREWPQLPGGQKKAILAVLLLLAGAILAQFLFGTGTDDWRRLDALLPGMQLLSVSAFLYGIWKWGRRYSLPLGAIAVLYLAAFNGLEMGSLSLPPDLTSSSLAYAGLVTLAYMTIPAFVITMTAILVLNSLQPAPGSGGSGRPSRKALIAQGVLILLLLGSLVYTFVWLWIWDGMDDGVRVILLLMASGVTVVSVGLVIAMTSSGWQRWAGLPFAGLILALLYGGVIPIGNRYSNYSVTEERARLIQAAIESYHAKAGRYPSDLEQVTPGELWRIPLPMIIPDQDWCYEGGSNYYRLGLVYREHWSAPYLSVREYASAGNLPGESWVCDQKLAELRAEYDLMFNSPPTPVPLPESSVSVPRTVVEPVLSGRSFSVGSWSPDGSYLVFGPAEYFMDEVERVTIDLYFLEAGNGTLCQPPESQWTVQQSDGLRDHYAWLPDGRFLYVTEAGDMWVYRPCVGDSEDLSNRFSTRFTHILSFHEGSEQVLLKDQDGVWLLNGTSLETRMIAGLPTEAHWAWYAWSRDGVRLAASMLMGPEESDGAFLYIIDTGSGEVLQELALQSVSDANLPIIEWLTPDELLLHGKTLTVMDFRADPPVTTDLIREVFLLDIEYPLDVSSVDTRPHPDGDGYTVGVRANHPRNQGIYLYDSKEGQVRVFEHDTHSLFFFEDGRWLRLFKWEDTPSYTDEYETVWVGRAGQDQRLAIEGHVPRSHPQMFPRYLPESSRLVFSSSQGISLVALPGGETLRFWQPSGGADFFSVYPAPHEEALAVVADGDGLYYIPLPP